MKNTLYILLIAFVFSCSSTTQEIALTASKNEVTFYNGQLKELNTSSTNIYVWNKKENKISETPLGGDFIYKKGGILVFIPSFPLMENTEYVVVFKGENGRTKQHFTLPKINRKSLEIIAIYPSSNVLPENLLRMYINFSQPMKTQGNLKHIKLINEEEEEIKGAIFNNVYELWDTTQKQLTIIFDPARVKTDLNANKELGRALKPNKTFKVVIENLEDIYGQILEKPYTKTFKVIKADYTPPNTNTWEIATPIANSKESLIVEFLAPLDRMSLYNRIKIVNEDNKIVKGKIDIGNREKTWVFRPEFPWKEDNYKLHINARLADPSGNNLNGLFDHKLGGLKNEREGEIISLPFLIK